ncbi:hypothetical protein LCGC14_0774230 [marine sediment metagenome]|uniref:Uncharacterized protein n=1 Tax=marine sediment metagenome TaxID=412755 RepID=A0A0F9PXN5_9ZZZZ
MEDTEKPADEKPADADKPDAEKEEASTEADSSTSIVDNAVKAADRLEKANEMASKNLDRQEKLDARRALGGRAEAGQEVKPKTQDDADQEEADEILHYGED